MCDDDMINEVLYLWPLYGLGMTHMSMKDVETHYGAELSSVMNDAHETNSPILRRSYFPFPFEYSCHIVSHFPY